MRAILIAVGLLLIFIPGCKKKKITSELIYSTLNEIIIQESISADTVWSDFSRIELPHGKKYQYLLSEASFMNLQINNPVLRKIEGGKLYFYPRDRRVLTESFIDTTSSKFTSISFSIPVFSRDLKTLILEINYTDHGYSKIYKKINDHWKKIDTYNTWIE